MSRLDEIVSRCDSWDESKHPRDKKGQFGSKGKTPNRSVEQRRRDITGGPMPPHKSREERRQEILSGNRKVTIPEKEKKE